MFRSSGQCLEQLRWIFPFTSSRLSNVILAQPATQKRRCVSHTNYNRLSIMPGKFGDLSMDARRLPLIAEVPRNLIAPTKHRWSLS